MLKILARRRFNFIDTATILGSCVSIHSEQYWLAVIIYVVGVEASIFAERVYWPEYNAN